MRTQGKLGDCPRCPRQAPGAVPGATTSTRATAETLARRGQIAFSHPRFLASVTPMQALGQKPSLATRLLPDGGWSKEVTGLPASVVRVTGKATQILSFQKSNQLPAQAPFYLALVLFSYGTVSHQTLIVTTVWSLNLEGVRIRP